MPFIPATSRASTLRGSWSLGRMPAGHESELHVARYFWLPTVGRAVCQVKTCGAVIRVIVLSDPGHPFGIPRSPPAS